MTPVGTPEQSVAYHGRVGLIARAARGPGPINAQVLFPDGSRAIFPRGNLVALEEDGP